MKRILAPGVRPVPERPTCRLRTAKAYEAGQALFIRNSGVRLATRELIARCTGMNMWLQFQLCQELSHAGKAIVIVSGAKLSGKTVSDGLVSAEE